LVICGKILACVKCVQFLVIVNREEVKLMSPRQGLQQGDPLSPYLFILCLEIVMAFIMETMTYMCFCAHCKNFHSLQASCQLLEFTKLRSVAIRKSIKRAYMSPQ